MRSTDMLHHFYTLVLQTCSVSVTAFPSVGPWLRVSLEVLYCVPLVRAAVRMGASCTKHKEEAPSIDDEKRHLQSIWAAQAIGSLSDRYESKIAALEAQVAELRSSKQRLEAELDHVSELDLSVSANQPAPAVAEGVILGIEPEPLMGAALHSIDDEGTVAVGRPLQVQVGRAPTHPGARRGGPSAADTFV